EHVAPNVLRYGLGKIEDLSTSGMPSDLILAGQDTWIGCRLGWHMYCAGIRRVLAPRGGKFVSRSTLLLAAMRFVRALVTRTESKLIQATRGLRVRMLRQPALASVVRELRYLEQRAAGSFGIGGLRASTDTLVKLPPLLAAEQFVPGRVALVNGGLAWGGVERQIVCLLRHLALRPSVESVMLVCQNLFDTPGCDFFLPRLKDAPADVVEATSAADDGILVAACRRNPDAAGFIANLPRELQVEVRRFAVEFLRRRPAIVHAFQDTPSAAAGLAAVIVGVPRIILSSRNMRPTNFAYYRSYLLPTYRALAACERVVLSNNSDAGAADYARWIGVPRSHFQVLRNGIADIPRPDAAEVATFRQSLGVPDGAPLVGSVFRFYAEKRPLLWIEVAGQLARRFPDAHFLIVGTGPMRGKMLRRAKSLGIADRLHMPGTTHNVPVAISALSVFVLTSEFEGTPNVVLEAGLLGVPVVVTQAGGTGETIDQGRTGWCVPEADAKSIAARVAQVLGDPAWAAAAKAAAPEFIRARFGLQRMIDETIAQYGLVATAEARHADAPAASG
ncbi:MAG: glycosyltransferase, partial [Acidobacteriota bacterium]|nr:glycosyltransferase [Acidobacteriota bacterium]